MAAKPLLYVYKILWRGVGWNQFRRGALTPFYPAHTLPAIAQSGVKTVTGSLVQNRGLEESRKWEESERGWVGDRERVESE
jgi:hypothetical protein